MADTDVFKHSTPSLYDRFMGPLLFDPYAKYVAERVALLQPERILETAAGTGIVTRAVTEAVPEATMVATDINPALVDFAAKHVQSERVTFQQADAQDLPFADATFDLVLVSIRGHVLSGQGSRERRGPPCPSARRPLRPGDLQPPGSQSSPTGGRYCGGDAPRYMERGPFSYTDAARVEDDLGSAGFESIELETVELSSPVTASDAAHGIVLGSPFRAEIERLDVSALERATAAVADALLPWDGKSAPMSAHIATATR
jgi:hypothetical protein